MISVALEGALSPKHVISVVSAKVRRLNSFSRKHTLKTGDAEFERCGNLPGKEARRKDGSLGYSSFSLPEDGVVYFTGIAGRGGVSWPSNSIKSATNNQGPQWIHYNYLYDPLTFSLAPPAGQSFPLIQRNTSTSLSVLSDLLIFPLVPTWCRHFWFWLNWLGLPLNVTQIFINHWGR